MVAYLGQIVFILLCLVEFYDIYWSISYLKPIDLSYSVLNWPSVGRLHKLLTLR
jgi:hypothetical protein